MRSSRCHSLHLERSTSVGDIGSSLNSGLSIDEDYIPKTTKKKFQPQPVIEKSSQNINTRSKDSKPAERSNATRPSQAPSEPSQNPDKLLKQATPAMADLLSHVAVAKSVSKDEKQPSTPPRAPVIERIYFIRSPERELSLAKKIDEDDELGLFGEFIKNCTLCKKELKPDENVYMYSDRPFCSSNCRDDRIALDGFSRKDFGLGKEDQKMIKSLRKDLKQLQIHL